MYADFVLDGDKPLCRCGTCQKFDKNDPFSPSDHGWCREMKHYVKPEEYCSRGKIREDL